MGYTTCRDICPAIVVDMMWIEKHLPPGAADRVRFAFFSFDPEADTPERLRLYADGHGLDLGRWTLLRGDDDAVRELAAALGRRLPPERPERLRARRGYLPSRREGRNRLPAARGASEFGRTAGQVAQFALGGQLGCVDEFSPVDAFGIPAVNQA